MLRTSESCAMAPEKTKHAKFTRRLAFKLTAGVGLGLLLLITGAAFLIVHNQEDRSIEEMRRTGNWFSDTVKRATRYGMLKDQRQSVHNIIEAIGQQKGVEVIRVFNKKGRIMFSSRAGEIGRMVDMDSEACYACHFRDRPLERLSTSERSRIFTTAGVGGEHRVLGVVNPIYTEKVCFNDPCHAHAADQKVLGVLDVALSLKEVDSDLAATTRRVVLNALVMFAIVSAVVALFTYYFVNRPAQLAVERHPPHHQGRLRAPGDAHDQGRAGRPGPVL